MVELTLKSDPHRPGWFSAEEAPHLSSETTRWRIVSRPHIWRPPTDVYEVDETIIVRVEIAGMRDAEFSISLEERYLTIRGLRPDVPERRAYYQMEIPFGEFITEVELPCQVVVDEIEAIYRDGFLRIVLPKLRPSQIKIED